MSGQGTVVAIQRPAVVRPKDLRALVEDLAEWRRNPTVHTQLLIVDSNGAVPHGKQTPEMAAMLVAGLCHVAARYQAGVYHVAPTEYAVMAAADGARSLELLRDVKIAMLRVVEKHAPDHFGNINQARFAMIFDLAENFRGAAERVAKYTADAQKAADPDAKKQELRPLSPADLDNILHACAKFGADKFLKAFMRDQAVVQVAPGAEPVPVMHEYYVSMESLRKPLFIDVEMRASGPLFNEFTCVLDQVVLRSFSHLGGITPMPFSLNVNVVTTFTAAFADFMDRTDKAILSRLTFEFRQADIVEHFDEFEVARGMIKAMGASIGVDKIFPQTLGLIDLDYIGAKYAKVHWRTGSQDVLRERGKTFKYMRECGIQPILIRVDTLDALSLGAELGVDMFQGFAIDTLLRQKAA